MQTIQLVAVELSLQRSSQLRVAPKPSRAGEGDEANLGGQKEQPKDTRARPIVALPAGDNRTDFSAKTPTNGDQFGTQWINLDPLCQLPVAG